MKFLLEDKNDSQQCFQNIKMAISQFRDNFVAAWEIH